MEHAVLQFSYIDYNTKKKAVKGRSTIDIVVALASIIIGDTILKNKENMSGTLRAVIGAIIYKIIGGVAIDLGMEGGYGAVDVVVGTGATLLAGILARRMPCLWMAALPPVLVNMLLIEIGRAHV